jgi:membrane protein
MDPRVLERILAPFTRRWGWARTALRVHQRFSEVHGGYLASAVTLAAFISIFPLLLVAIAVFGFITHGNPDFPRKVIEQLGLTGEAANSMVTTLGTASESRRAASIIGLVALLWTGLGLVAAIEFAFDAVWQVAGRGIKDKAVGLLWLVGSALLMAMSFLITGLLNFLSGWLTPLLLLVGLAFDLGLWLFALKVLTNRPLPWKALLPGAIVGAIGLEVLKALGALYVPHAVASSSALYGSLGTVFAILAWLFFFGELTVYAAVVNVIRWEEDHGTVTVEIEVPRMPGPAPAGVNRAGESTAATGVNAPTA